MQGLLLQQRLASAALASCSGRGATPARPAAARQRRLCGSRTPRAPTQLRAGDDDKVNSLLAPPGGHRRRGGATAAAFTTWPSIPCDCYPAGAGN